MDFAAALAQTAPRKGPTCSVGKALADADPAQAEQVSVALGDANIQTAHLTRALGLLFESKFDSQAVSRHRKGQCNCGS